MKDWNPILIGLVRRLVPALAFAALMVLVGIFLWRWLPVNYRPVPFLLALLGVIVFTLIEVRRIRQRALPKEIKVEFDKIGAPMGSAVATRNRGLVIQKVSVIAPEKSESEREKLERQLEEYLDWVCGSYGTITLRGIEQEGRQVINLPLDSVYVPLLAEYQPEEELVGEEAIIERRMRERQAELRQKVALNEIFSVGAHLMLIGGPGSGKTTVLIHCAWTLAEALRTGDASLAEKRLGLKPPVPVPIYVPLSLFALHLRNLKPEAKAQEKTLATYITEYLTQRQSTLELDPQFFKRVLDSDRHVLLLLDGLDEVPSEVERVQMRAKIEDLAAGRENLRVVATCRTAAHRGLATLGRDFKRLHVLPLEEEQMKALVFRAYQSIYKSSPKLADEMAQDLLKSILDLEEKRRVRLGDRYEPLVDSPLMVRLLLIVHAAERRKLPDQRADLYQKAVDVLLRPEYAPDVSAMQVIETSITGSLAGNREMMQILAFHMHAKGDEQGREVDEEGLRNAFTSEPSYAPYVDALIAQSCQRGTLLEERGGLYRFIHLSFQEFLAGRYLATILSDPDAIVHFLEQGAILETWWREPVLLMAGYLDLDTPTRARKLLLRLAGLDERAEERHKRLKPDVQLAAAEVAAEAYLECKNQASDLAEQLKARLLALVQGSQGTPLRRAAAADALDRLGYLPQDLYRFMLIPEETPFYLARYPVTNAQYQRFLQAEDFAERELWIGFPQFDEESQRMEGQSWGERGWEWLQSHWDEHRRIYPRYWDNPRFGVARKGAPVVGITWFEANAYCRWLHKHWQELEERKENSEIVPDEVRLPTEAEWVAAAGGENPPERFPWDAPKQATQAEAEILRRANVDESGIGRTTPVGMYPLGASPHGVWDLAGNVWEWQANYSGKSLDYLALRGGSWNDALGDARLSVRDDAHPDYGWHDRGFRVAVLPRRS